MLDCKAKILDFNLGIGDEDYNIDNSNMIIPYSSTKGMLAMEAVDGSRFGPQWILGYPFIRQFCNIYDVGNKRMGFAHLLKP